MIPIEDIVGRELKPREMLPFIVTWLAEREAIVIVGSRQVGKSCLMFLLVQHLLKSRLAQPENIAFLDLEAPDDLEASSGAAETLLQHLRLAGKRFDAGRRLYLFIDELQYLDNPSRLVKLLVDHHPEIKVIASGSSSTGLRKKFKDSLPGRKQDFHLQSLTFKEFLSFRGERELSELTGNFCLRHISEGKLPQPDAVRPFLQRLLPLFEEYAIYGGYPAVVVADSVDVKRKRLQSIINDYLRKDIHSLFDIEHLGAFTQLLKILAGQVGSLVVFSELTTPIGITYRTLQRYLDILTTTFIVELIPPCFPNIKKTVVKSPKAYFYDIGIRNALISHFDPLPDRPDKGHVVENVMFQLLAGLGDVANPLCFWRTHSGSEMDFILRDVAIEVKYQPMKAPRIPRGMQSGMNEVKARSGLIVTKDFLDTTRLRGATVQFVPACLLSR